MEGICRAMIERERFLEHDGLHGRKGRRASILQKPAITIPPKAVAAPHVPVGKGITHQVEVSCGHFYLRLSGTRWCRTMGATWRYRSRTGSQTAYMFTRFWKKE